jgi:hypothetical protein
VLSTPVIHEEHEHVLAQVEVRLGLEANLLSPYLLEVSVPPAHPVVPVVDTAAHRREH